MAWLITLALFLCIGGWVCGIIDKANYRSYERLQVSSNQIQAVKGNIYAIAWQHCLDLQVEYLRQNPDIPAGETLPYHYTQEHGISLQQLSVIYALEDLRKRGKQVLRVRNNAPQIVQPNDPYDAHAEAEGVRGVLDPIYGPFSMPCAYKVDDEVAVAIAKPIWDREVVGTNIVKWDRQTGRIMY